MKNLPRSVILFSVLFFFGACGGRYEAPAASMLKMSGAAMYNDTQFDYEEVSASATGGRSVHTMAADSSSPSLGELSVEQTRKLVKMADLSLRVENPEAMETPLTELMGKYDAWSSSTGIYENFRNYSIRVPSPLYDSMLTELSGLGKMLRRTENTEDVSLRYYDLESRLATKKELLRTYQGYLSKANNIDEIMTVESRIADLQQEIDWTGTQFRNLSNLVDYSTIHLEIVGPANASSYSEPTLREKLSGLFGSFGRVISSALVVLMGIIIYGIPAIIILILLFWILFGRIGLLKKLWFLVAGKK